MTTIQLLFSFLYNRTPTFFPFLIFPWCRWLIWTGTPRLCEINGWKIRIYAQNVYTQLPLPPPSVRMMCSMMRRPPLRLTVFVLMVPSFALPFHHATPSISCVMCTMQTVHCKFRCLLTLFCSSPFRSFSRYSSNFSGISCIFIAHAHHGYSYTNAFQLYRFFLSLINEWFNFSNFYDIQFIFACRTMAIRMHFSCQRANFACSILLASPIRHFPSCVNLLMKCCYKMLLCISANEMECRCFCKMNSNFWNLLPVCHIFSSFITIVARHSVINILYSWTIINNNHLSST